MANWTAEQLDEMGFCEPIDRAMFLSSCTKHTINFGDHTGYVVSEQNLQQFAQLIVKECVDVYNKINNSGSQLNPDCFLQALTNHFGVEK